MGALCRWILLIGAGPLAAAGIGGTVTRADSAAPIDGATITAINLLAPGAPVAGVSDAAGQYALTVPAGTYAVFASAPGFASELFQEQPCCDNPGNATPIVLGDGETRTDVHFTLAPGARIHGMLRRRADATPLPGFNVRALQDGVAVATTLSDGNGDYVLDLAPGSYVVEAAGDGVLFDERYPDAQCAAGQCRGDVQAVSVGTGTAVTGIDLNLSPPARIVVSMGRVESGQSMDGAIWYWIDGDAATTPTRVDTVSGIATLELLGSGSLRVAASADTCGAAQDRVCLSELRCIVDDMKPTILDLFGFREAIEALLARQASAASPKIRHAVTDVSDGLIDALPAAVRATLYRITQEAVNNAVSHSGATRIDVGVSVNDGALAIEVIDDGVGFDSRVARRRCGGVTHMSTRADLICARVEIEVGRERPGTLVRVLLPIDALETPVR